MPIKFKPLANPIMLVSDNPGLTGGLSRLCRDVSTLCATLPQFRVAVLGRGISQRRKLPFIVYDFPEYAQWGEGYIAQAWNDFSGEDDGVIFTLDDISRRHWFANPVGLDADMQKFLGPGRNFKKWGYFPVDSTGTNGWSLPIAGCDALAGYDRVMAASEWGCNVLKASSRQDADWLPHGIWADVFSHRHRPVEFDTNIITVGCVMANQSRKDYPAAFQCFSCLKRHYGNRFKAWVHTDTQIQYWNLFALAAEYGVSDCLEITTNLPDEMLAVRYSNCDCTILPSAGEGFGYPIAESLACGTACIVTDYAAGPELVSSACSVIPRFFKVDTQHCVRRAVIDGFSFADAARYQIDAKRLDWAFRSKQLSDSVAHLDWNKLSKSWEKWLLGGLNDC